MSVAATSGRFEQHDIVRLQGQLLEVAHRDAVDMEFSGGAGLAAAQPLGAFFDAARHRVEQPFVVSLQAELDDLTVAAARCALAAGAGTQLLAVEQRASTFRKLSGKLIYIITTRRMISGGELKQRHGLAGLRSLGMVSPYLVAINLPVVHLL
jgi:hypothetical protein